VLGPYLLIFWLLFSNAILFNIIVAIICDAFSNVIIENEELDEKGVKSVIDIFLESGILGHRLSKMLSKKKQELGDIENALDLMDGDGDGLTDMGELEAWLKATGADKTLGITALEIMSKYDSDGSGQLDKEEMEEIKEWIRSEQEALKRAEAGEDDEDDGKGQSNAQIDAMMTMMSNLGGGGGGGGGYSAAMEERVLNIENKIGSLDGKLDKLMANLETIVANGGMGMGMGGSVAGAASRRGEQSVRGGSVYEAAGAKNVMQTGKMIASKALVSEEI
jgi:Ca2+-binding EF-hand superfamily protein